MAEDVDMDGFIVWQRMLTWMGDCVAEDVDVDV